MSRRVCLPVRVACTPEDEPVAIGFEGDLPAGRGKPYLVPIRARISHWREWVGVLDGEPERDVWQVETALGVCELHCLRYHPCGQGDQTRTAGALESEREAEREGEWLLFRWED